MNINNIYCPAKISIYALILGKMMYPKNSSYDPVLNRVLNVFLYEVNNYISQNIYANCQPRSKFNGLSSSNYKL